MSFRFIDGEGREHELPDLPSLVSRIKAGDVRPDMLIFDERAGRWQRAEEMDIYQTTLVASVAGRILVPEGEDVRHALPRHDDDTRGGRESISLPNTVSGQHERPTGPGVERPEGARDELVSAPAHDVYPGMRFWARWIDYIIAMMLLGVVAAFAYPTFLDHTFGGAHILAVLIWVPIEAGLISVFGATPGKYLLSIRVVDAAGHKLKYSHSFDRAFRVWAQGMGAGLPIIDLVTMARSRAYLKKHGETAWDRGGATRTLHRQLGWFRVTTAVVIVAAMLVLVVIGYADL